MMTFHTPVDIDPMACCPSTPIATPGRRFDLRAAREQFVRWLAGARSHRVICVVLGIWLLNGFDLAFTLLSHEQGMLHEENPLARHILQMGTPSILLYKLGLVCIGSYPLLKHRAARVTELGALVVLAVYTVVAVRWSICYEFYAVAFPLNIHNMAAAQLSSSVMPW